MRIYRALEELRVGSVQETRLGATRCGEDASGSQRSLPAMNLTQASVTLPMFGRKPLEMET
jgi:hypothetical protein